MTKIKIGNYQKLVMTKIKIGNDKNGEMALNLYKSLGMDIASIIQDKNHFNYTF